MSEQSAVKAILQFLVVATVCGLFAFALWAEVFHGYRIPKPLYMLFVGIVGWILGKGIKGVVKFK